MKPITIIAPAIIAGAVLATRKGKDMAEKTTKKVDKKTTKKSTAKKVAKKTTAKATAKKATAKKATAKKATAKKVAKKTTAKATAKKATAKKVAKKTTATKKQLDSLKKGREALKKKQETAKKAVRKEISKTKKAVKKATAKIVTSARKKAIKATSRQMQSLSKRLKKKGLAGGDNFNHYACTYADVNTEEWEYHYKLRIWRNTIQEIMEELKKEFCKNRNVTFYYYGNGMIVIEDDNDRSWNLVSHITKDVYPSRTEFFDAGFEEFIQEDWEDED